MENFEQNGNTCKKSAELQSELIQDEALLRDGGRISLKAFKNWSWNLVWKGKYGGKFFVFYLIMFGIGILMSFLDSGLTALCGLEDSETSLTIFQDIANGILTIGLLGFSLNIAKGLAQKVENFFREINWDRIWRYFVGSLLYGLVVLGGCILLIIPGIIFAIRFQFFTYAIIDKGLGPVDALKYSWRITKGRVSEIIGFDLYFLSWNIVGMLCLIVGLIWTTAMTQISIARYYRFISNMYDKNLPIGDESKKIV